MPRSHLPESLAARDAAARGVPPPTPADSAFPATTGTIYAVCGFLGGAGLFAPSALLAYLMLGCWSRSAGCEITGPAVLGMLVAAAAFLVPLAGGFVSALRGEPDAMLTALAAAFVLVVAEWTIVLSESG